MNPELLERQIERAEYAMKRCAEHGLVEEWAACARKIEELKSQRPERKVRELEMERLQRALGNG
jgi:hypothetical protein